MAWNPISILSAVLLSTNVDNGGGHFEVRPPAADLSFSISSDCRSGESRRRQAGHGRFQDRANQGLVRGSATSKSQAAHRESCSVADQPMDRNEAVEEHRRSHLGFRLVFLSADEQQQTDLWFLSYKDRRWGDNPKPAAGGVSTREAVHNRTKTRLSPSGSGTPPWQTRPQRLSGPKVECLATGSDSMVNRPQIVRCWIGNGGRRQLLGLQLQDGEHGSMIRGLRLLNHFRLNEAK